MKNGVKWGSCHSEEGLNSTKSGQQHCLVEFALFCPIQHGSSIFPSYLHEISIYPCRPRGQIGLVSCQNSSVSPRGGSVFWEGGPSRGQIPVRLGGGGLTLPLGQNRVGLGGSWGGGWLSTPWYPWNRRSKRGCRMKHRSPSELRRRRPRQPSVGFGPMRKSSLRAFSRGMGHLMAPW